ncbi:MAG: hypothetical protein Q8L86_03055 [Vicinamibacterales bacterium]|nr:hypothetical protein [Vicinamibacterales bacterium]
MTVIKTLQSFQNQVRTATSASLAYIGELARRYTEARARLKALEAGAMSRREVEQLVRDQIARDGRAWLDEHGYALRQFIARARPRLKVRHLPDYGRALVEWGALCASDPDGAYARVMTLIEANGYQPGPDAEQYKADVTALLTELASHERDHEHAVDAALEAGLQVEHLPHVQQRREDEARARQLEDERVVDRQRRQAALDDAHVAHADGRESRTATSSYLS